MCSVEGIVGLLFSFTGTEERYRKTKNPHLWCPPNASKTLASNCYVRSRISINSGNVPAGLASVFESRRRCGRAVR